MTLEEQILHQRSLLCIICESLLEVTHYFESFVTLELQNTALVILSMICKSIFEAMFFERFRIVCLFFSLGGCV